jgi:hypothetical protein
VGATRQVSACTATGQQPGQGGALFACAYLEGTPVFSYSQPVQVISQEEQRALFALHSKDDKDTGESGKPPLSSADPSLAQPVSVLQLLRRCWRVGESGCSSLQIGATTPFQPDWEERDSLLSVRCLVGPAATWCR